jgi:hypothetical protein
VTDETKDDLDRRSMERYARATVDFLENAMENALSSHVQLHAADRAIMELGFKTLRPSFDELSMVIEPMRDSTPNRLECGYEWIRQLMMAAYFVGAAGALTKSAREFFLAPINEERRQAGKRSGEVRRENRLWVAHFEELAKQSRTKTPSLSQDDLATEIAALWRDGENKPPKHATMKKHISEMEHEGRLPKRCLNR